MQNKKLLFIVLGVITIILLIGGAFAYINFTRSASQKTPIIQSLTKEVVVGGKTLTVEVADSRGEQTRGLKNRKSLDENSGMLFVFGQSNVYAFWMKDTLIPLDMIFISEDKKIVNVRENVQPCESDPCDKIIPESPVKYVIEVNGGWASRNNVGVGDSVEIPD